MSKINIELDTLNKRVADDIERGIKSGIRKGSGATSRTGLSDQMEEVAQHKLRTENKVWTGQLISSFKATHKSTMGMKSFTIVFTNTADHAAPIEYGADYNEKGPPLIPLAVWLMTGGADYPPPSDPPDEETIRDRLDGEELIGPQGEEIDPLDEFPKAIIDQAFNIQDHIREHGIDPVRFMESAEQYAENAGAHTLADAIEAELDKRV